MIRPRGFSDCFVSSEFRDFSMPRRQDYKQVPETFLCSLFQRGRHIDEYVTDFINVSHHVRVCEERIKQYFLSGLDLEVLRDLPDEDPDCSLEQLIDFVLLYCGSHFTVGEVDEDEDVHARGNDRRNHRAASVKSDPWLGSRMAIRRMLPSRKMAADREVQPKMAVDRETPSAMWEDLPSLLHPDSVQPGQVQSVPVVQPGELLSANPVSNLPITGPSPASQCGKPYKALLVPVLQPERLFQALSVPVMQPGVLYDVQSVPVTQPDELLKALMVSSQSVTGSSPVARYEGSCHFWSVPVTQPDELLKALMVSSHSVMGSTPVARYEEPCAVVSVCDLGFVWPDPPDPVCDPDPVWPDPPDPVGDPDPWWPDPPAPAGEPSEILAVSSPHLSGPSPKSRSEEPCYVLRAVRNPRGFHPKSRSEEPCYVLRAVRNPRGFHPKSRSEEPCYVLRAVRNPRGFHPKSRFEEPCYVLSVPVSQPGELSEILVVPSPYLSGPSPESRSEEPSETLVSTPEVLPVAAHPPERSDNSPEVPLVAAQPSDPVPQASGLLYCPDPTMEGLSVAARLPGMLTLVMESPGAPLMAAPPPSRSGQTLNVSLLFCAVLPSGPPWWASPPSGPLKWASPQPGPPWWSSPLPAPLEWASPLPAPLWWMSPSPPSSKWASPQPGSPWWASPLPAPLEWASPLPAPLWWMSPSPPSSRWASPPPAPPWWASPPSAPPRWASPPSAPPRWASPPSAPPKWTSPPSAPPWWAFPPAPKFGASGSRPFEGGLCNDQLDVPAQATGGHSSAQLTLNSELL
ncbi:hypothetical protein M9458_030326, partial [Cirrhinus mrigala]